MAGSREADPAESGAHAPADVVGGRLGQVICQCPRAFVDALIATPWEKCPRLINILTEHRGWKPPAHLLPEDPFQPKTSHIKPSPLVYFPSCLPSPFLMKSQRSGA